MNFRCWPWLANTLTNLYQTIGQHVAGVTPITRNYKFGRTTENQPVAPKTLHILIRGETPVRKAPQLSMGLHRAEVLNECDKGIIIRGICKLNMRGPLPGSLLVPELAVLQVLLKEIFTAVQLFGRNRSGLAVFAPDHERFTVSLN
jgi:hypothetical protein